MQGNLAWVERSDTDCAEGCAVSIPRNQSARRIVGEICAAQASVERAAQFRVVEQIGCVRGDLHSEALANREGPAETKIDIEPARPAQVANGRRRVAYPILIGDEVPVRRCEDFALERAGVVLEERILSGRHDQTAWQRDLRLSVVPMLQLCRDR